MKTFFTTCMVVMLYASSVAQCSFTTTNGSVIELEIYPIALVKPLSPCLFGYNYDLTIRYELDNPSNVRIDNLQVASISCVNSATQTFTNNNIPRSPAGRGQITTTNNQYTARTDCATSTLASLGCLTGIPTVTISGEGLSFRTVNCPLSPILLPVQLSNFNARIVGTLVELEWSTLSEVNLRKFEVERSPDASTWFTIHTIDRVGSSNSLLKYNFTDKATGTKMLYYRIQKVDRDGTHAYSRIIGVKPPTFVENLSAGSFSKGVLEIRGMQNTKDWTVQVTDVSGRIVANQGMQNNKIALASSSAAGGLFYVKCFHKPSGTTQVLKVPTF
ncbi:MAG: hypothetical protein EAY75_08450 [Bacteroidetes bacterium]|nr:MAG: hypothetical protein EAY75_08450 [Bacteroidota bacterium]